MKTSLLLLLAVVALAVAGEIVVTDADVTCSGPDDCTTVYTSCNYCGCGVAVNVTAAARINAELKTTCASNTGPVAMCDMFCIASVPSCVDHKCGNVPLPGPVFVDPALQTCVENTDCTVFDPNCEHGCCGSGNTVAVSVSNLASLQASWEKTCASVAAQPQCLMACPMLYQEPKCIEKHCTINGELPPPPDPIANCSGKVASDPLCKCAVVAYSSTGQSVSDYVCPVTCVGENPDPASCYCGASNTGGVTLDTSTSLKWICAKDLCADQPIPEGGVNCYCASVGVPVGDSNSATIGVVSGSKWICEQPSCCTTALTIPVDYPCLSPKIQCIQGTAGCKWDYTCPPPPTCDCNDIPVAYSTTVGGSTSSPSIMPPECSVGVSYYCAVDIGIDGNGEVVPIGGVINVTASSTVGVSSNGKRDIAPDYAQHCGKLISYCPNSTEFSCKADFTCGAYCSDAATFAPPMCAMLWSPEAQCKQDCAHKFSTCAPLVTGTVRTCGLIYSQDYDTCVNSCFGVIKPDLECTYIHDKCSCESHHCIWGETTLQLGAPTVVNGEQTSVVSIGQCASVGSGVQFAATHSTISSGSNGGTEVVNDHYKRGGIVCNSIVKDVPVTITQDAKTEIVAACLADDRCANTSSINAVIKEISAAAPADAVEKQYIIVVKLIIKADSNGASLTVDITGDKTPTSDELKKICVIVSNSVAEHININPERIESCTLSKVNNPSKKRVMQTNTYVADLVVNQPEAQSGDATLLIPAAVSLVGAALALF